MNFELAYCSCTEVRDPR